jgi:hypothetical protein
MLTLRESQFNVLIIKRLQIIIRFDHNIKNRYSIGNWGIFRFWGETD